jgi:GABA permease
MWLFPYLSYCAVLAMVGVLIAMAISPEHQEEFKASVISVLVVLAAYVVHRRFKKHA